MMNLQGILSQEMPGKIERVYSMSSLQQLRAIKDSLDTTYDTAVGLRGNSVFLGLRSLAG